MKNTRIFKIGGIFFLMLIFMMSSFDAEAQRKRKKRKSRDKDKQEAEGPGFKERLIYEVGAGGLNFGGQSGYSVFSTSFKSTVGYKISNRFAMGVGGKLNYDFYNYPQGFEDFSFLSYGALAYGKFKITEQIYAVAEYNVTSFEFVDINFINRETASAPLIGGEYMNGVGQWKYGFQLLFVIDEVYRDYNSNGIVDWWFNLRYNF